MTIHSSNNLKNLREIWIRKYMTAPTQLKKMSDVRGLISAFNANIDAVIKISGERIEELVSLQNLDEKRLITEGERRIQSVEDFLRGIIHCFQSGIAEEWLIEDEAIFSWLDDNIGYDRLQMGGQGGIVANVMAVCGVDPVYVHCASLPADQAALFLDLENLQTVDQNGDLRKARSINRQDDTPLVHWIIEFDKGDVLNCSGQSFECPKSNRFIATYDPLNFKLHIDKHFAEAMAELSEKVEIIVLSGYQMLKEILGDGTPGKKRIDSSINSIKRWRSVNERQITHLEMASTQDRVMRKYLLDTLAKEVDSLGFNERELIDLLEVMGEDNLAEKCEKDTSGVNLFQGMLRIFSYTGVPRLQLHMFGLYLTLQKRNFVISPEKGRNGMQLASVIAATKAGTGSINTREVLLWAKDQPVSDIGLSELTSLSDFIEANYGENSLPESGVFECIDFEMIAVPTILIDKPVTLVGMGDTISSVSLVAAR